MYVPTISCAVVRFVVHVISSQVLLLPGLEPMFHYGIVIIYL